MEALNLNNNDYSEGTVDTVASPAVTTNELQLTINHNNSNSTGAASNGTTDRTCKAASHKPVEVSRNGKGSQVTMLPGNQEYPVAGEVHTLPEKASSPYVENGVDITRSHHQDVSDVSCHAATKRASRKMSQQENKETTHPVRVTRSTSKLMAAQVTAESSQVSSKHNGCRTVDNSAGEHIQSQCSTNSTDGQIKYNKSKGFSVTARATNWTRSEMNKMFTNKGMNEDGHHSNKVNRDDVNMRSHIAGDHIVNDLAKPLHNVTNSLGGSSDTTATVKPQARVYDLVAGKKSKKGKRQQPRKAVLLPHKKKPSAPEESENTATSTTAPKEGLACANGGNSVRHVKDTLHHGQASQHCRSSTVSE